jgi:prepilin-type N-terminal cleavage/methylation domain-containing protein
MERIKERIRKIVNVVKKETKRGFTLVELIAVIGIAGILLAIILLGAAGARKASEISATSREVQTIYSACQAWLGDGRTNYANISLTDLQTAGLLPANTINNSWGGTYSVAPGADDSQVTISTTDVPDQNTYTEIQSSLGAILVSSNFGGGTASFTF